MAVSVVVASLMGGTALAQTPAREDGPLARAIAAAAQQDIRDRYAFTRTLKIDAEDERIDRVERYDPSRRAGERWMLLEVDGAPPDEADLEEYDPDKSSEDPFEFYRDVIEGLDLDDVDLVEEDDQRAVYRLRETGSSFLDEDAAEFADYVESSIIVDKSAAVPYVAEFSIIAPEAFKPSFAAEINAFVTRFRYAPYPGTTDILPREVAVDLSLEVLFFFDVEATTSIRFDDYVPIGEGGD